MFNIFKKRDLHTPEPERKKGLYAYSFYVTGGIIALLWVLIFGLKPITQSYAEVRGVIDPAYKITRAAEVAAANDEEPAPQLSPEEQAAKLYPMPAGAVDDSYYIDPQSIDIDYMRKFQAYIKQWEANHGGKNFIIWHESLKPVVEPKKLHVEKAGKTLVIKPLTYDMKATNLTDFQGFELLKWNIDRYYMADDERPLSAAEKEKCISNYNAVGKPERGAKVCNEPKYLGQKRVKLSQGACVFLYLGRPNIVECGKVWGDFISAVYFARNDNELRQASPLYQYTFINNQEMDRRKASTQAATDKARAARADYIAQARGNKNKSSTRDSVALISNAEAGERNNIVKNVFEADYQQREALRFTALFGAFILFALSFLTGFKWSIFRKPSFIPQHVYIGGFVFLGAYWLSFAGTTESAAPSLWAALVAFLPPLAFFTIPVYAMVLKEVAKESQFYQQNVLEGRGNESNNPIYWHSCILWLCNYRYFYIISYLGLYWCLRLSPCSAHWMDHVSTYI